MRKRGFMGSGGRERVFSGIESIYNKEEEEEEWKMYDFVEELRWLEVRGC